MRTFRTPDGKWNAEVTHRGEYRAFDKDKGELENKFSLATPERDGERPAVLGGHATEAAAVKAAEAWQRRRSGKSGEPRPAKAPRASKPRGTSKRTEKPAD